MGLTCRHISKSYATRSGEVAALQDVSFDVESHEFVCIVGPSGCGKTTLLRLIAGLLPPTSGEIYFETPHTNGRAGRAMVFQSESLFPWLSVRDNMAFGLEAQGVKRDERLRRTMEMISRVGLEGFAQALPHELSGGMQQRVALARALLTDPAMLLMDEPFGALDAQTRFVLQEELLRIWQQDRKMVLFVTHDIEEAILLSDRVLVMSSRPGFIQEEIAIPLERPRDLKARDHPKLLEIKWHIWKRLEDDVRRNLKVTIQ